MASAHPNATWVVVYPALLLCYGGISDKSLHICVQKGKGFLGLELHICGQKEGLGDRGITLGSALNRFESE